VQPIEIKMGDVRAVITKPGRYQIEIWRESIGRANSMTQMFASKLECVSWVTDWAEATADATL
jgi:hypothetical protein